MMKKWNLVVDVAQCHNCHSCFISCKDEYVGNDIPGYSAPQPLHGANWIQMLSKERGRIPIVDVAHLPTMCNHCDEAPCVATGRGAVRKRDDGIVLIDPQAARGRRDLIDSCPYGAMHWNEELQLPQAWTFDAHLLDRGWPAPRCVQSCPTGALQVLKVSDQEMAERVAAEKLEALRPELKTRARVHYKNLHRFTKLFVGGCAVVSQGGRTECAAQAQVELLKDGRVHASTTTDEFGEFKFDALAPGSGSYELRFSGSPYRTQVFAVELAQESIVLSSIELH